jgi:hypothetical protein
MTRNKLRIPSVLKWTALGGAAVVTSLACGGGTSPSCETCADSGVRDAKVDHEQARDAAVADRTAPTDARLETSIPESSPEEPFTVPDGELV